METVDVEAKSLASEQLPAIITMDENQRRLRDYLQSIDPSQKGFSSIEKKTFVVNTNSPLMNAIQKLDQSQPELAQEMVKEVYELALLSQREIDTASLNDFVKRTSYVLKNS